MSERQRDPGAARERTWLAWQRTAIVFAVNGILLLRSEDGRVIAGAFAVLVVAVLLGVWSTSSLAERLAMRRGAAFQERWMNAALLALCGAVAALALGAILLTRA